MAEAKLDLDNAALEAVLAAARRDGLEDAAPRLLGSAMDECPVAETGNLRRSHGIDDSDPEAREWAVEATADYAAAVHEGARPHTIRNAFGRGESVEHPGNKANPWMRRAIDREAR